MATGPKFSRPPVVEVALGVQFEPIEGLGVAHMAKYWEEIREEYPGWTEHPLLPHIVEGFGPPSAGPARMQIELGPSHHPLRRSWFATADGDRLQQLQADRFICNWRRYQSPNAPYPGYAEAHRPAFIQALTDLKSFLQHRDLGAIEPNHVEVTYVNHVEGDPERGSHSDLHRILRVLSPDHLVPEPGPPENLELALRYLIKDEEQRPIGRLHVIAKPVFRRSDKAYLYEITLTARVGLDKTSDSDLYQALDRGHRFLVESFRSITTDDMHRAWGLEHG